VWEASTGAQVHTLEGHSGEVTAVQFSRDGSKLASASGDKKVMVWEASTGAQLHTLEGHSGGVRAVQFSRDGSKLASASWDMTVVVWNASTGSLLQRIYTQTRVSSLKFSADGFFIRTNVGRFELQAASGGPSGSDGWTSRPQLSGYLWHHRQKVWPPAGRLLLGCAVADEGSRIASDHTSGAINVIEDDNQHDSDEIESPTDASTPPLSSSTSEEDTHTSSFQLQGDWIHVQNHRMIWLPPELRPVYDATAVHREMMVIGHSAGNISFWETSDLLERYTNLHPEQS
jgi:WD40 repeat protein